MSKNKTQIFFNNGACIRPLKINTHYISINSNGEYRFKIWDGDHEDFYRLQSQNVFLTKEAVQKAKYIIDTHNRISAIIKEIDNQNQDLIHNKEGNANEIHVFFWNKITGKKSMYKSASVESFCPNCFTNEAKDYLMSDEVSDKDFKAFCLIY